MSIDPVLIGCWKIDRSSPDFTYEVTPTGKFFVWDRVYTYQISQDGLALTITYPQETAAFNRKGEPSSALTGCWARFYPEDNETETCNYNSDGTYVGDWNQTDYFWGFYLDVTSTIRTGEYRASWSTNGEILRVAANGSFFESRLIIESTDRFKVIDLNDSTETTYSRTPCVV
ncbi:MAG: hypothetical protein HGB11_15920 [Chlorobiales bacterium]|nr:hypothetical protein [Chlorobiales bacterium]